MSFVHLRCHSEYSLLDSTIQTRFLVNRVNELNQPAVALTDHNVLHGAIEFYKNARNYAQIKPIIGIEICLRESMDGQIKGDNVEKKVFHTLLLARDNTGYKNLIDLTNIANLSSYEEPCISKDDLVGHSEGLICTTGCLDAEIPYKILTGCNLSNLKDIIGWYYEIFGKENFFFELQDHGTNDYQTVNRNLLDLQSYFNSKYIATNDVHYLNSDDVKTYELLEHIKNHKGKGGKKWANRITGTHYLKSSEEMAALFANIPSALVNTLLIAEMCNVQLDFRGYQLPNVTFPENSENIDINLFLREICLKGLRYRFGDNIAPVIEKQLDHELEIISNMGWSIIFLMMWDICQHAKKKNIWWTLRGSANSSLVVYVCGMSHINPLEYKLVFERFINPGRISMPDFDFDFTEDGISEITNYITRKYGSENIARIASFNVFGSHNAIRESGHVLGMKKPIIDKIVKFIPNQIGVRSSIKKSLNEDLVFQSYYQSHPQIKSWIDIASQIENLTRSVTVHPCGIIIGYKLRNFLPLCQPPRGVRNMKTDVMSQFEMGVIESLGYLKQDFINLPILSVMQRACNIIKEHEGIEYNLENIPVDNKLAFDLLGKGDVAGLFGIEGYGMRRVLKQIDPTNIEHIADAMALHKPGPMAFIPDYVSRKKGEVEIEYRHVDLIPIFEGTYGIPVYQEQTMQLAIKLAGLTTESEESIGYSLSMADELRKSISKRQKEGLIMHEEKFISAAIYNGYNPSVAEAVYADISEFARYAFQKAHAIAYAKIVCQCAFLKANYPNEYMAALISEKIILRKTGNDYIASARRMGLTIIHPDINKSEVNCTLEYIETPSKSIAIRLGLANVKHLGQKITEQIITERLRSGTYTSFNNLIQRCNFITNKLSIKSLYEEGALDTLLELDLEKGSIDKFNETLKILESI